MKKLLVVLFTTALVTVMATVTGQTPAVPSPPDIIRVTITPGKSVTIYAPASRVSTHNNQMGEEVVEIDTTPRTVVLP